MVLCKPATEMKYILKALPKISKKDAKLYYWNNLICVEFGDDRNGTKAK